MQIDFDPTKDAANVVKHGVSLARAADLETVVVVRDHRFVEERYRLYGTVDGELHCLAATFRDGRLRAISLRRAHGKELRRHV